MLLCKLSFLVIFQPSGRIRSVCLSIIRHCGQFGQLGITSNEYVSDCQLEPACYRLIARSGICTEFEAESENWVSQADLPQKFT